MDPDLLSISLVSEYVYCPSNFYYRAVEQVTETNHHMVAGSIQENQRQTREHLQLGDREKSAMSTWSLKPIV